jgi:hypothetical protein
MLSLTSRNMDDLDDPDANQEFRATDKNTLEIVLRQRIVLLLIFAGFL